MKLIVCVGVCLIVGLIGSVFTTPKIPAWYATLTKPAFTPPNWLFAPVWIALYILMGISAYLIWRKGFNTKYVKIAFILFIVQLSLNALWSPVFFGLESLLSGLFIIVLLWLVLLFTVIYSFRVSVASGILLLPYIVWVSYASVLNAYLWVLNR